MKFLVIAKINTTGAHISFTTDCQTTNDAIQKAMKYCDSEGYFVNEIRAYQNHLCVDLGGDED